MINAIVAMDSRRCIGRGHELPWPRLNADVKHFIQKTSGSTVVMGRKTFESIGKPLPKRENIVLSRTMPKTPGIKSARSLDDALDLIKPFDNVFVIGGAETYSLFLPYIEKFYITSIRQEFDGDVFLPELDPLNWRFETVDGEISLDIITESELELLFYTLIRR